MRQIKDIPPCGQTERSPAEGIDEEESFSPLEQDDLLAE
jgi:hypothetical protein